MLCSILQWKQGTGVVPGHCFVEDRHWDLYLILNVLVLIWLLEHCHGLIRSGLCPREEGYDRYKMVVQVVIGEQRGEGVNMAARCFWDADTDSCAHDVFMNDSLFCVVAAFGCFYY
ncbi:dynein light chain Tctex-type protein 2B isoform 5-T10 [Sylvia borin]